MGIRSPPERLSEPEPKPDPEDPPDVRELAHSERAFLGYLDDTDREWVRVLVYREETGAKRSTAREAIRELTRIGLLESRPCLFNPTATSYSLNEAGAAAAENVPDGERYKIRESSTDRSGFSLDTAGAAVSIDEAHEDYRNLPPMARDVLHYVAKEGEVTSKQAQAELDIAKGTVRRHIESMGNRLLESRPDPDAERGGRKLWSLSVVGKRALAGHLRSMGMPQ